MSAQAFDNLNLLLQIQQATRNLATGFRRVASDNLAMAQAVPPTIALADLQSNITNLGNSVQNTLTTSYDDRIWN